MSSSSGKGGSSQSSLNYYGTLAGALCWGPLDWVTGVIANGNYVFQGNLSLTTDVTDLTGSILDPELLAPGGYLKIYRGTETQPADPAFVGHCPYPGTAWLAAKHIFFGQNSGTAPNLQVIGGRIPRVDTSIVAAIHNIAEDGQTNPVAQWAELLMDERGGGMDMAELDAPSWLASAAWCAQDSAHRAFTFCSPLITQQAALRDHARALLDPFNGFCRRTKTGKLACMVYEWGVDPGGLPLLDARQWLKAPPMTLGDWDSVPTELMVTFTSRDYEYQTDSVIVPNAHAQQVRQLDDPGRIDRPHVTRKTQANRQGAEYNRRIGTAPSSGILDVRAPFVFDLAPGDKVKLDTDPEPGGGGLAQIARVKRIEQDRGDRAVIHIVTDNLLPAVPYSPTWTAAEPVDDVSPAMLNFIGVPLPPATFGLPPTVAILASRPSAAVVGMEVYFSRGSGEPYDELGQQIGFAVRATLSGGFSDTATTLAFAQTDGLSAPDAGLAANTPGGNTTAAANNTLLALIAELDGSGRIAQDSDGDPIMEFVSIVDRSFVSGTTFNYEVLRGRLDTEAQGWTSGAKVWIFPRSNLVAWRHLLLDTLTGLTAYFRLVSYTSRAVNDTVPVPELAVNMIPATAPMYQRALDVNFVFIFQRSPTLPATPSGLYPVGWFDGPPSGTDPVWMSRAAKRRDTGSLVVAWSTPIRFDGASGSAGVNGLNNAVVFIYQRSASAPALPSAATTYTFATAALTGLNNGWSSTIPGGTDPLYVSAATASASTATDTLAAGEWAGAVILALNGTAGTPGAAGGNSASVFIYKRSASAPALPSATTTYTFATAALTGLNNGWGQVIPGGTDPLYVSTATAFSSASTDSITAGEWASAEILASNGGPGDSVQVEWSVDGATSWHFPFASGDIYFRQRLGSGAWSGAIRGVGEKGDKGDAGDVATIGPGDITSIMLEDGAVSTISVAHTAGAKYTSNPSGASEQFQEIGITTAGEPVTVLASICWVPLDNFTFTFQILLDGVNVHEVSMKSPEIGPCQISFAIALEPSADYHNIALHVLYTSSFWQATPFTKRFLQAIALKK